MAKISAYGSQEVCRANFKANGDYTGILVLRSDRKVLRRWTGDTGTAYNVLGKIKAETDITTKAKAQGVLRRIAEKRGWEITKES